MTPPHPARAATHDAAHFCHCRQEEPRPIKIRQRWRIMQKLNYPCWEIRSDSGTHYGEAQDGSIKFENRSGKTMRRESVKKTQDRLSLHSCTKKTDQEKRHTKHNILHFWWDFNPDYLGCFKVLLGEVLHQAEHSSSDFHMIPDHDGATYTCTAKTGPQERSLWISKKISSNGVRKNNCH